jgi:hypothetical protein
MTDIEQLRHWAQVAGIPAETVRDRADLVGLFQHFRPNGDGMDAPLRQVASAQVDAIMPSDDSPDVWIFDLIANFTTTLTPADTPLLLLKDAIYSMANDKLLQLYVMWPLYKETSELNDPFRSYFLLWAKGIRYTMPSSDECLFCT